MVSWPLSRFAKGKNEVTVTFAVQGTSDNSDVSYILLLCFTKGGYGEATVLFLSR